MAPSAPADSIQGNGSLHERTNHTRYMNIIPRNGEEDGAAKAVEAILQRARSLKQSTARLDSSETLSSSPGYICNAEIVWENTSPIVTPRKHEQTEPFLPPLTTISSSAAPLSRLSNIQLSPPHSGWPPTRLEPIIEKSIRNNLHSSDSRLRLRSSPERKSNIIRPMLSVQSIRPAVSDVPIEGVSKGQFGSRFRSFSLNDLDCFPKSDTNQAWPHSPQQHSSSSDEILRALRTCPIFPLKPAHSPPYRSPTPPGLPSFGTREAEEYRLTPSSPPNRAMTILQRWIGRPYEESDDRFSVASNPLSSPTSPTSPSSPTSPPMNMLKRVLGATRLVESPQQSHNPRSRLPAGIRIASLPGALVQADDGTWVRGRWTSRASSHRVGTRPLDEHPMVHTAGLHSIDEIVREIDKACQAVDEENRSRLMDATQVIVENPAESSYRTILPLSPLPSPSRSLRAAEDTERIGAHVSVLADGWRASSLPFTPCVRDETSMSNTSFRSPLHVDTALPVSIPTPQPSMRQDGIAGFREYVEQGERECARQSIASRKEKHHCGKECWEGFWSFCCCMTGSTGDQVVA